MKMQVYLAPVYYPSGRDQDGVAQYKKILYEMDELTADNLDTALKSIGLIDEASLFCDLVIEESDVIADAVDNVRITKIRRIPQNSTAWTERGLLAQIKPQ